MIAMDPGPSLCTNGVNNQNVAKKEALIQRIKHQRNVIKMLEEQFSRASDKHHDLSKEIEHRLNASDQLLHTLNIRTLQNERDIKTVLVPSASNLQTSGHGDSSPSFVLTTSQPFVLRRSQVGLKRPAVSSGIGSDGIFEAPNCGSGTDLSCISIDPCVDLVLCRFLRSLRSSEAQIAANQAELQRSKFTVDSQNGKRMMSRLRLLETENAALAKQKDSGRPAKVSNVIALRRRCIERIRMASARTERLIDEAESEVEVFTSTLLMLQQQLSIANTTIEMLSVALASSAPASAKQCVSLLRAAQWPLPAALQLYEAEEGEPAKSTSIALPPPSRFNVPTAVVTSSAFAVQSFDVRQ